MGADFGVIRFELFCHGGVDGPGGPSAGRFDEALEDCSAAGADLGAALGMPLDSKDKVGFFAFGSLAAFDGFDDAILWAAGRDAETVARDSDGLVMAGVDGETKEIVLNGGFSGGSETAEDGFGGDGCGVGDGNGGSCGMIYGENGEVLQEGAAAPDVEDLDAEADGEDGFVEGMGVLEEELVYIFAGWISRGGRGIGVVAVLLGVYVGGGAGEENGLAGVDEVGCLAGGEVEGELDWIATGGGDGCGVLGPGAGVIGEVVAGGGGDGDARATHVSSILREQAEGGIHLTKWAQPA